MSESAIRDGHTPLVPFRRRGRQRLIAIAARQHGVFTRARRARSDSSDECGRAPRRPRDLDRAHLEHVFRLSGAPMTDRRASWRRPLGRAGRDRQRSDRARTPWRPWSPARSRRSSVVGRRPPRWALPASASPFGSCAYHRTDVDGIPSRHRRQCPVRPRPHASAARDSRASVDTALAATRTTIAELVDAPRRPRRAADEPASARCGASWPTRQDLVRPDASGARVRVPRARSRARLAEPERQVDLAGTRHWIGRVDFALAGARARRRDRRRRSSTTAHRPRERRTPGPRARSRGLDGAALQLARHRAPTDVGRPHSAHRTRGRGLTYSDTRVARQRVAIRAPKPGGAGRQ